MCDTGGVYRRLSTAKTTAKTLSVGLFLRHWLLQTPGEENPKKRKKYLSLAISKNYINKKFLFF